MSNRWSRKRILLFIAVLAAILTIATMFMTRSILEDVVLWLRTPPHGFIQKEGRVALSGDELATLGLALGINLPSSTKSVRTFVYDYEDDHEGPLRMYVRIDLKASDVPTLVGSSWLNSSEPSEKPDGFGTHRMLPPWFDARSCRSDDKFFYQKTPPRSSPSTDRKALLRLSGPIATLYLECETGVPGFSSLIPALSKYETYSGVPIRTPAPRTFEREYP